MNDQVEEERWLERFHVEVKARLRRALIHLDGEVQRRGTFFTSIVDERSGLREVAFRVGPASAPHEIKLVYIGAGRVTAEAGQQIAEHSIEVLDQPLLNKIARAWLVEVGVL